MRKYHKKLGTISAYNFKEAATDIRYLCVFDGFEPEFDLKPDEESTLKEVRKKLHTDQLNVLGLTEFEEYRNRKTLERLRLNLEARLGSASSKIRAQLVEKELDRMEANSPRKLANPNNFYELLSGVEKWKKTTIDPMKVSAQAFYTDVARMTREGEAAIRERQLSEMRKM